MARGAPISGPQRWGGWGWGDTFPHSQTSQQAFYGKWQVKKWEPSGGGDNGDLLSVKVPFRSCSDIGPISTLTPWLGGASVEAGRKTLHPRRSQTATAGKGRRKREFWGSQLRSL